MKKPNYFLEPCSYLFLSFIFFEICKLIGLEKSKLLLNNDISILSIYVLPTLFCVCGIILFTYAYMFFCSLSVFSERQINS